MKEQSAQRDETRKTNCERLLPPPQLKWLTCIRTVILAPYHWTRHMSLSVTLFFTFSRRTPRLPFLFLAFSIIHVDSCSRQPSQHKLYKHFLLLTHPPPPLPPRPPPPLLLHPRAIPPLTYLAPESSFLLLLPSLSWSPTAPVPVPRSKAPMSRCGSFASARRGTRTLRTSPGLFCMCSTLDASEMAPPRCLAPSLDMEPVKSLVRVAVELISKSTQAPLPVDGWYSSVPCRPAHPVVVRLASGFPQSGVDGATVRQEVDLSHSPSVWACPRPWRRRRFAAVL